MRRSDPTIKIVDDIVTISFQTIVDFKAHLDYTYFPMSDHRLNIVLENRSVTPNELCFVSSKDNFALADEKILTSTWRPQEKKLWSQDILRRCSQRMTHHLKQTIPVLPLHSNLPTVVFVT